MNATLTVGQHLKGKTGFYQIIKQVHQHVWTAMQDQLTRYLCLSCSDSMLAKGKSQLSKVVVKTAHSID